MLIKPLIVIYPTSTLVVIQLNSTNILVVHIISSKELVEMALVLFIFIYIQANPCIYQQLSWETLTISTRLLIENIFSYLHNVVSLVIGLLEGSASYCFAKI